jgi:hypothetical protein
MGITGVCLSGFADAGGNRNSASPAFHKFVGLSSALDSLFNAKPLFARMFAEQRRIYPGINEYQGLCCHIHVLGEGGVAQVNGSAHEGEAFVGDPVATRTLNFGNQAMSTQELQETTEAATAAALRLRICGLGQCKVTGYVAGVKTPLDVFATQDRQEQLLVLTAERVQCTTTAALKRDRGAGAVNDLRTDPGVLDHSQRSEVTLRGLT